MSEWFTGAPPPTQALAAGLFTWAVTAAGAATVFLNRQVNRRLLDAMLGFAAGVMLAASYWSLLAPAIAIAEHRGGSPWLPAMSGFLMGGAVIWALDRIIPHLHPSKPRAQAEGPSTTWHSSILLVLAITLHNIPEGLAVGVAFGGAEGDHPSASLGAAVALALGIGIQNFPEGVAVAMPLRAAGMQAGRAFWFGQMSGFVEPVTAVIGAIAVGFAAPILPYALAFAAGAMVFVVAEELIPESHAAGNVDLATVALMVGFAAMMVLDVALG